jgi:DNA topoisomerase-2
MFLLNSHYFSTAIILQDYTTQGDNEEVYFEVILTEQNMNIAKEEGLVKKFKLTTTIGTSNMHLFDSDGKIRKYDTPEQSKCSSSYFCYKTFFVVILSLNVYNCQNISAVLDDFYKLRLEFYFKRKVHAVNFVLFRIFFELQINSCFLCRKQYCKI